MTWGDLITLEYGKPVKDKACTDGETPVYGTNGQIGSSHLPPLCKHASFIIGRKGAYRGVHYSDVPFSVIDTAFYAEPVSDKIDLKWAYYKFLTYDINRMDSGSAIPSTDRYEIYKIEVNPPPLETQRKIARLLGSLESKIKCNQQINDKLIALRDALLPRLMSGELDVSGLDL
ncbi:MAG: restriction endonuclease subunit S [Oscillibacter sp.]|nr:restriction endonuclease subunit S [Oscillibacter sp.]